MTELKCKKSMILAVLTNWPISFVFSDTLQPISQNVSYTHTSRYPKINNECHETGEFVEHNVLVLSINMFANNMHCN